jgi:putative protease
MASSVDLGDKRYLLSPQDLAAVDEIPRLIELGIRSFKIEGRLKTPEYVAGVTQVYRAAIDRALAGKPAPATDADRYALEMTFSRGLYPGWMHGVNHQELVGAYYGKKRGPYVGESHPHPGRGHAGARCAAHRHEAGRRRRL